jgi:ubiquinone/menaquinone biosynthesis C-methylase UbiE
MVRRWAVQPMRRTPRSQYRRSMPSPSYRLFTGAGAENYQRDFVPVIATPVSRDLLRVANLRVGERVLDVACGTGLVTRLASQRVGATGSVTGVDIAADMIDVAKSVPAPDGAAIDWHIADATSLPIADGSVDVVLCQMGLMCIENRVAAIAEMRRALRPSGRLVINTPGRIQPFFAAMEQAIVDNISPDLGGFVSAVFSMHDPAAVVALIREGGFRDVASEVSTSTFRLPPPGEFLWQYINLSPMAAIAEQASDPAREALERQVVERTRSCVVDGVTVVEQPMVIAIGRA